MKKNIGISVVATVKNDNEGVERLREDLKKQTRKPDEIIIIRAEDHGNCSRAEGRNIGIKKARYDIIAVTDVGCRPHSDWLEQLTSPFASRGRSCIGPSSLELAVAGFYNTVVVTSFQQAIAPYLGVKHTKHYLPASRSIAFTKKAWELVGGYPEEAVSAGEDLEFARRLSKHPRIKIIQAPQALVDWEPPKNLEQYFDNIADHTRSNLEVKIWPHIFRNFTVLLRWVFFLLIPQLTPFYLLWPIGKHYRDIKSFRALLWLPIIQLVTDAAILVSIINWWDIIKKQ